MRFGGKKKEVKEAENPCAKKRHRTNDGSPTSKVARTLDPVWQHVEE